MRFSCGKVCGGGNWVVAVGVFGEDSCTDSGESSASRLGILDDFVDADLFGGTDVVDDWAPAVLTSLRLEAVSSIISTPSVGLNLVDLTYVAWLDVLDLMDSFDLSSCREPDREMSDVLDLGRSESSERSFEVDDLPCRFFSLDTSVSGGLGGRSSLRDDCLLSFESSVDLDRRLLSEPRSVGSGVNSSSWGAEPPRSSRLWTASLLCALLKEGYGRLTLLPAMEVRASSGTRSLMEEAFSFFARSLSLSSLVRCRRWCVEADMDESASMVLDLEDRCDLWRWTSLESLSLSDLERSLLLRRSRGRSSRRLLTSLGDAPSTWGSLEPMVAKLAAQSGVDSSLLRFRADTLWLNFAPRGWNKRPVDRIVAAIEIFGISSWS